MIDLLAHLPGLVSQPNPETEEHEPLINELSFACVSAQSEDECQAIILRIMIGRGYWPLGTRWFDKVGWTFPSPAEKAS